MNKKKPLLKTLNNLYPIFISGFLIYFLVIQLEEYDFRKQLSFIDWKIVVFVLLFFGIIKITNTFRYSYLYKIKKRIQLFWVLCFCNAFLSLLPFRLGELSYIKYLKDYFKIDYKKATQKLIVLRVFDLAIVYILFLISSLWVSANVKSEAVWYVSVLIFAGLIICLIVFGVFSFFRNRFSKKGFLSKIFDFLDNSIKEFRSIKRTDLVVLFSYSLFYWLLRIFLGFLILNLLGLNLDFFLVAFVSFLLLLIGLFPIKTFADFGIFEAGWAYFLVLIGFNYQEILPTIINFHILSLLPAVIYGFIGWLMLKFILDK